MPMTQRERSYAVLSCDLDPVDRHLQGYGFDGEPPCDLIYQRAVPRLLDVLAEAGAPAVLFVVGRDAEAQRKLWREATAAGHEVASHSLTHPQPFRTLDDARLREETATSRARLEQATGAEVAGFRAPAWDVDHRVLNAVQAAGYRYDASMFPTPVLLLSRLAAYRRSVGKHSIFSMDIFGHAFAACAPHRLANGTSGLVEFPVSVTPWMRLPVYHTVSHLIPAWLFKRWLRGLLRSRLPVCYEFHAADLLDPEDDPVDRRMLRHPGMALALARKRAVLRETIAAIASARRIITYRQALAEGLVQ
jgi:hypothetical protein